MNKEQVLKKVSTEAELYTHYTKIMEAMLKWCIFDQPDDIKVFISAFGVDTRRLAVKAMKEVVEKYESNEERGKQTP